MAKRTRQPARVRVAPDRTAVEPTALEPTALDEGESPSLTLEELAESTGVPPRTIRYYQAEKLLQKPARDANDARVARYGTDHSERLRLIGELRDRGLKLPAIRTLLNEGDSSIRIVDWLGLDDSLRGSWSHDAPQIIGREELTEKLTDTPAGTQAQLEDARLVFRHGTAWLVPNPNLLDLTVGLIAQGIRAELVLEAGAILQKQLSTAANELIELFVTALSEGFGHGYGQGTDPAALVNTLRPMAGEAARMIFGQQLQRAIEALLADTKRLGRL